MSSCGCGGGADASLAPPVSDPGTIRRLACVVPLPSIPVTPWKPPTEAQIDEVRGRVYTDLDAAMAFLDEDDRQEAAEWQTRVESSRAGRGLAAGPQPELPDFELEFSDCVAARLEEYRLKREVIPFIDRDLFGGMQEHAGRPVRAEEKCGWLFQGYALPLYDPPENNDWWNSLIGGIHARNWAPNLGYHVWTTSTSTVYLDDLCTYRIYFPSPQVNTDRLATTTGKSTIGFPKRNLADTEGTGVTFPADADWQAASDPTTGARFKTGYVSFVDSQKGVMFPIYAPEMEPDGPGVWRAKSWRKAGWTATAIPSDPVTVSGEPFRIRYADITVIDLYQEHGWYLMIAVECRSEVGSSTPKDCTEDVDGCAAHWVTPTGDTIYTSLPQTRIVVFGSRDPSFQKVFPTPGIYDEAMVLLQPEACSLSPNCDPTTTTRGGYDCPREAHGVPHAIKLSFRPETLMLYAPWQGVGCDDGTGPCALLPSRVQERYPEGSYRNPGDDSKPIWHNGYGGISCFELATDLLCGWLNVAESVASGTWPATWLAVAQAGLRAQVDAGYNGEILVTDGSVSSPPYPSSTGTSWDKPTVLSPLTDPHFVEHDGELWMYWDAYPQSPPCASGSFSDSSNNQIWRARMVGKYQLHDETGSDFSQVLSPNGDYTLFLTDTTCARQFDLRSLWETSVYSECGWPDYGRLTSDPDVIQLADGTIRVSFFGAQEEGLCGGGQGLLFAVSNVQGGLGDGASEPQPVRR